MSLILDALRPIDCRRAKAAGRIITGECANYDVVEFCGVRLRAPYTGCEWAELPALIEALGWRSLRVRRVGPLWRIRRGVK